MKNDLTDGISPYRNGLNTTKCTQNEYSIEVEWLLKIFLNLKILTLKWGKEPFFL